MSEVWKSVPGFGGHYEASNTGLIRSKERTVWKRTRHGGMMQQVYSEKLLSPHVSRGYLRVTIGVEGKSLAVSVHRLILLAFHGLAPADAVCRHLNGVRHDNRPENLSWGSHLENMSDRKVHGMYAVGERHAMAKLSIQQVREIRAGRLTGAQASRTFNISQSQVSRIKRGQNWGEVA